MTMRTRRQPGRQPGRQPRRVLGQALIELLVTCIALLPMFWALSLLGKYLSLQDSVINASRWLAFECTVRATECETDPNALTDETQLWASHFSAIDSPVRRGGAPGRFSESAGPNPLWVDENNRPLISSAHSLRAVIVEDRFDAGMAVAVSARGAATDAAVRMAQAGPERFDFDARSGLFRFSINAAVNAVNAAGQTAANQRHATLVMPGLNLSARSAILIDPWNASGSAGTDPDSVQSRVALAHDPLPTESATPDFDYLAIRSLLNQLGELGLEPQAGRFRFRETNASLLPEDRLGSQ